MTMDRLATEKAVFADHDENPSRSEDPVTLMEERSNKEMVTTNPDPYSTEALKRFFRVALIPAYNEERFIGSVVLQAFWYAQTVIVVDDASSDDTARIAEEAGATLVRHETNQGKAKALESGLLYIRKMPWDLWEDGMALVILDGDGQHHCSDIPAMTAPIFSGEADIVIGSRFLGMKSHIPRWRIFGQRMLTMATNLGSNCRVTDSQSGFRAFSEKSLLLLDFNSEGFSVESEMQFLVLEYNLRLKEVPIKVTYEKEALKRSPVGQALMVVNGILIMAGKYRPLLVFGGSGAVVMLSGTGLGMAVVSRFYNYGQLAVGYALICVLLSVLGMVLISTGVILHSVRDFLGNMLCKKE